MIVELNFFFLLQCLIIEQVELAQVFLLCFQYVSKVMASESWREQFSIIKQSLFRHKTENTVLLHRRGDLWCTKAPAT